MCRKSLWRAFVGLLCLCCGVAVLSLWESCAAQPADCGASGRPCRESSRDASEAQRIEPRVPESREPRKEAKPEPKPEPEPPAPNSLIDQGAWSQVPLKDDPFITRKPKVYKCADGAHKIEDGVLEMDTGACNFLTFTQKARINIAKGESLRVVLWHLGLYAETSAEAYAALTINGKTVWEVTTPIPSAPKIFDQTRTLSLDIQAGDTLHFHLQNHGVNTWKLLLIRHQQE